MRKQNETKVWITALVLLMFALVAPVAKAQGSRMLAKADIPFAFQYSDHVFPAGTYTLSLTSSHIMVVSGNNQAAVGMILRDDVYPSAARGKLVFRQVGAKYTLKQVSIPSIGATMDCPRVQESHRKSARRQEIVDATGPETTTEVALVNTIR